MKIDRPARAGFSHPRFLLTLAVCALGLLVALLAFALYPATTARAQKPAPNQETPGQPDVIPMIGPVSQDQDLRMLPYIPPNDEHDDALLMRHPFPLPQAPHQPSDPLEVVRQILPPPAIPAPSLVFGGIASAASGCTNCYPPDTTGDVGPNHYIQTVNSAFQIFDKTGATLSGPTTYNSFFAALGPATPCGSSQNRGDPIVIYDQIADRWVLTDLAFPAFPGTSFYECVGVSKTSDPVAGGWWLYALQTDPANPNWLGDYPKFGLWPDAYYFSVNLFATQFSADGFAGVRVYALPRAAMLNGTGAPNLAAVAYTIVPTTLGDVFSLVPATFRTGAAPPAGRPEYFAAINSSSAAGAIETKVFVWRFHVDFVTPANSIFGLGFDHVANASITVNGFKEAINSDGQEVVGQPSSTQLDSVGERLMTPLVYQNRDGAESLYASHTVFLSDGFTTGIRWYQFNVSGSTIPATPLQQQSFGNGADGLYRWMPSIAVDALGNLAIGYSTSSFQVEPSIRYAGRFTNDPLNTLAQGEAIMMAGGGHQSPSRWGDYTALTIDPSDNLTFWHTNEYYTVTSFSDWSTEIGTFKFPASCVVTVLNEKFDSVSPPTLPAGWSATNGQGSAPFWVTSATTPDTPPNDAFVDDPNTISDKNLDTPALAINSSSAQVVFRNSYNLENTFDGAVLEVSSPNINAGTFTDVGAPAVGGSFVTGGYSATISGCCFSPLAGRSAWSGNSGGYVTTVANLGPNVAGHTIKLRFRMASDSSNAGAGWRIDTILVTDVMCPTPTPTPPPPTPTATPPPVSTPTPTLPPTPTPPAAPGTLGNISTRLRVETGDNVLIGGFIITGTQPKKVILRAIGPSLPFGGVIADPLLELRNSSGGLILANDNWRSDQQAEIIATTIPPGNDLESAIVATLPANSAAYTATVSGVNNGSGIGLVEVYDLNQAVDSKLANISTRGLVQAGDNVMIGGFIVLGQNPLRVIVRGIGPSLSVPGKLADPTLELRDGNGGLLAANDNWRSDQEAEIIATGIPPGNDLESAIVATLPAGQASYTATVRGVNGTTGVGLVEVYALAP